MLLIDQMKRHKGTHEAQTHQEAKQRSDKRQCEGNVRQQATPDSPANRDGDPDETDDAHDVGPQGDAEHPSRQWGQGVRFTHVDVFVTSESEAFQETDTATKKHAHQTNRDKVPCASTLHLLTHNDQHEAQNGPRKARTIL